MTAITVTVITIERQELLREFSGPPVIIFGRRKTGKTFFVKNFIKPKHYFFIKRNKSIYYENKKRSLDYDSFEIILDEIIERNETVAIDEFHRLGEEFLDFLHAKSPSNVILITSTLHFFEKMIGKKSPILGLFSLFRVDLIDERDVLREVSKHVKDPKRLVEYCVFLREPLTIKFFSENFFKRIMRVTKYIVPGLVGEIFDEEERKLTEIYEGIIRAISGGRLTPTEISSKLFSLKLIDRNDPGLVRKHLEILCKIGIIRRIKDFYRNRYFYEVISPLIDLYYYLDEKYNYSEEDLDEKYLLEKMPLYIESFFRDLLSKVFSMRVFEINLPNLQVDIVLGDFKKIKVVGEVKWKKKVDYEEIRKIEEKLKRFKDCRKILIVPEEKCLESYPEDVDVMDIRRILVKYL